MNTSKHLKLLGVVVGLAMTVILNARSDAFKPGFVDTLVGPYLEIQTSLAGDDLEGAQSSASAFVKALGEAPGAIPSDEIKGLNNPAASIGSASDISSARKSFKELSVEMTSLVTHVGTSGETPLFVAYCPMAFGNKGAAWLQGNQTVANPYYGSMMLRCGSIQKQLAGEE